MVLADTTSPITDGDGVSIKAFKQKMVLQIYVESTATVNVQGRIDAAAPWHTIGTFTASYVAGIDAMPYMRVLIPATAGRTAVWIG